MASDSESQDQTWDDQIRQLAEEYPDVVTIVEAPEVFELTFEPFTIFFDVSKAIQIINTEPVGCTKVPVTGLGTSFVGDGVDLQRALELPDEVMEIPLIAISVCEPLESKGPDVRLIDGNHRLTAAARRGYEFLPMFVLSVEQAQRIGHAELVDPSTKASHAMYGDLTVPVDNAVGYLDRGVDEGV